MIKLLREFSIPLVLGVIVALFWANLSPSTLEALAHTALFPFSETINLHFLVNEVFMVFFFGIAAVEITQAFLSGGDLNPLRRAVNPLIATCGGVLVPIALYLLLCSVFQAPGLVRGFGIPTATDIALAWLVARFIFGEKHPAISFLLLLAIVDDGIGLAIIAIFYPNPDVPTEPLWLVCTMLAMLLAFFLRRKKVLSYWPYVLVPGFLSWMGLYKAGLHPALALVFIVPFMPAGTQSYGHLFEDSAQDISTIHNFEQRFKVIVDFGLFFFGITNAGVVLSGMNLETWVVYSSLLLGKTVGVFSFAYAAIKFGFPLPRGMGYRELFVVGLIASLGLTVALFVAGVAFPPDSEFSGAAKMGALLSAINSLLAFAGARALGIRSSLDSENTP